MRYSVLFFSVFFYSCIIGQGLPGAWLGSYQGAIKNITDC